MSSKGKKSIKVSREDGGNEGQDDRRQEPYSSRDKDLLARIINELDTEKVLHSAQKDAGTNSAKKE